MQIDVTSDTFRLAQVFTISRGSRTEAQVLTVRISDGGVTGMGECVPYARYGETLESVTAQIEGLSGALTREGLYDLLPAGAALRSAVQGDDFATNLATLNAAVDRRAQEAPKTAMASQLATGMGIAAPFALRQAAMSRGGKAIEGALQGGVVGGSEGAVSGFFKGMFEDPSRGLLDMLGAGYEEGLNQGASGVKIGAGIGAVAPSIGEAAGGLYSRYLKEPIRDIVERIGFKDDAARVVQDTLAMDAAGAVESATSAGPYGSISTLGPNTQALLDVVANSPSKGARIARDNLKETSSIAARDLTDTLDNALGTPRGGLLEQKAQIMKDTAQARRELYDKAYDFELSADTDGGAEVIDLLSRVDSADMSSARTLLKESKERAV